MNLEPGEWAIENESGHVIRRGGADTPLNLRDLPPGQYTCVFGTGDEVHLRDEQPSLAQLRNIPPSAWSDEEGQAVWAHVDDLEAVAEAARPFAEFNVGGALAEALERLETK